MSITAQDIKRLSSYLSLIHHTSGRLRVKISPKIMEMKEVAKDLNLNAKSAQKIVSTIKGVKEFKLNPIMGTITILYDNDIFKNKFFEDIIEGENCEQNAIFINNIIKGV
jgi:hypothetical protein